MAKKNKEKLGFLKSMSPVRKAGALLLSGVILFSGVGVARSEVNRHKAVDKLEDLEKRREQLVVDIKTDDKYVTWLGDRYFTAREALEKDIIDQDQYNENVQKFTDDNYILDNISTIDYINQKYVTEKVNIDNETAEAKKSEKTWNITGAVYAGLLGVSSAVSAINLTQHARMMKYKKEQEGQESSENSEEIAM